SAAELGSDSGFESTFLRSSSWAHEHGHAASVPTFLNKGSGANLLHGVCLFKPGMAEGREVLRSELGEPASAARRLLAAEEWARRHGYATGVPSFHEGLSGAGVAYGIYLLKPEAVERKDVPLAELTFPPRD